MRILHLQKVSGIGGSERHLLQLLPALQRRQADIEMLVLREGNAGWFSARLQEQGVETREITAGPDINPMLLRRLTRMFHQSSANLIHTHLIHADVYGQMAGRLAHIPTVMTLHSGIFEFWNRGTRALIRRAAGKAQRVIAISEHVARAIERARLVPRSKVRVVPYGIEASDWMFDERARVLARERLGWDHEDLVIGVAARLIPLKGHDFLVDAFVQAAPRIERGILAIAGEGPLRRGLAERAASVSARIDLLGHVSDVKSFMNACDIVVFPTLRGLGEGFGLAALESLAAGRVTVATNVDSLPELIEHDRTGILVEPGDVPALADALVRLAADPEERRALGLAGQNGVTQRFPVENMVDRTIRVYEEAVESEN